MNHKPTDEEILTACREWYKQTRDNGGPSPSWSWKAQQMYSLFRARWSERHTVKLLRGDWAVYDTLLSPTKPVAVFPGSLSNPADDLLAYSRAADYAADREQRFPM